jgi:hypothetical protein
MMLLEYLEQIPDHRRGQGQRFKLKDILWVSILAILSGADSYRDIVRFAKARIKELREWFDIHWKRPPSKSNLGKIFCGLNKSRLEEVFQDYSRKLLELETQEGAPDQKGVMAIDGKSLRGSFDFAKGHDMIHLLSVFCTQNRIILGHVEIPEKTNEIPTAQWLIRSLGLPEGSIYTLDAMHCQKKHLKPLKRSKGSL